MTVAALAVVLWFLNRRDTAHQAQIRGERDQHRQEIADLLQRIQAPELAAYTHAQAADQDPDPYPKSDEETVAAMDEELVAALQRAEQIEREELILQ